MKEDILDFWCDAYKAGVRITYKDKRFVYEAVDWLRIHKTKTFGLFTVAPCEPPLDIVTETENRAKELLAILDQPVPPALATWWYHPLDSQYEGQPLLRMAAQLGTAVWLMPCRLGVWPQIVPTEPDRGVASLPQLSPILLNNGYSLNLAAYGLLQGGTVEKAKESRVRVENHLEPNR